MGLRTGQMLAEISPEAAAAAAKSLQSCPTLCDPVDGSPPGSPVPGILQAETLEWVAISFSNAWKWKVRVKSLSSVQLLATPWTADYQAPHPWDFPGKSTGVGCHHLRLLTPKMPVHISEPRLYWKSSLEAGAVSSRVSHSLRWKQDNSWLEEEASVRKRRPSSIETTVFVHLQQLLAQ